MRPVPGAIAAAELPAVAHVQRVREDRRHFARERCVRMPQVDGLTSAEEMIHTGLPHRVGELPIRCPSVAYEDAGEVGAQDGSGLVKPAAGLNRIHGGPVCGSELR
jgi:hypothetical protein